MDENNYNRAENLNLFSKNNYENNQINWTLIEGEKNYKDIERIIEPENNKDFENKDPFFYLELFLDENFYHFVSEESKKYFDKKCENENSIKKIIEINFIYWTLCF